MGDGYVNRNLEKIHDLFGGVDAISPDAQLFESDADDKFSFDGVDFVCDYASGSTADRFFIVKNAPHVRQYIELCEQFSGGVFVELGIAEGGSAAMAALVAAPAKLIALDLEPVRLAALDDFITARNLQRSVRPHYGIDQADQARLGALVDEELEGRPIDLVFDDASHVLEPTRRSFEVLFPRMRPGGLYVIEDWNTEYVWRHAMKEAFQQMSPEERIEAFAKGASDGEREPVDGVDPSGRPMSDIAVEMMLLRALPVDMVASVSVNRFELRVERGPAELDPDDFRLDDHKADFFGYLP